VQANDDRAATDAKWQQSHVIWCLNDVDIAGVNAGGQPPKQAEARDQIAYAWHSVGL
jgi:hypothetical protein